ncbi:MAG TPA: diguanylate cyclase [Xanthomonadales bacterium]|nr:diguanylate cyclase [Xanthomonadales bacterium]
MARSAVLVNFLLLALLLAATAPAQQAATGSAFPSQPTAVRDLRANFDLPADQLRLKALKLREQQSDPLDAAWATLALTEFENELEHEPEVFALLDALTATSAELEVRDLRFATLELCAVIYMHRNRVEQARAALDEMRQMVAQSPSRDWQTVLLHNEGVLQRKLGHFDESLAAFEAAAKLQRDTSNPAVLARELNSIGMLHGRTGRFSDAALVHNEALRLARQAGDKPEMARSLRLLGVLFRNLDDEERGTEYLREALAQVQARNHREAIILTGELGISLMNMERFDEAAGFIEQAVAMAEESGNAPNKVNAYSRMADLELVRGHWDEAKRWVDRAWLEHDHVAVRDQVLLGLSRVRVFSARGATAETLAQARTTLESARKLGDRILERAALDVVADLELGLGDAASAYATRKTHQKLDKELAMDMAGRRIAVLEASLEQERGNMEKQLLTSENQIKDLRITRQRYLGLALISGMIALVAVLLLLFWRVRTMRQTNTELRANRDQLAQLHAALLKTSERLEHMANTDALTGVANRHAVMRRIELVWQRGRIGGNGCLMLIDLDHFKLVNDRFSHLAGDSVLRSAAERMRSALPEQALLGRWGGEEFIVVLDSMPESTALELAERLRRQLDAAVDWKGSAIHCSGSIGVAMLDPEQFNSADEWIAASDRALYRAKREGRNRVQLASRDPAEDLALRTRADD